MLRFLIYAYYIIYKLKIEGKLIFRYNTNIVRILKSYNYKL